jgi:hypothetical protein
MGSNAHKTTIRDSRLLPDQRWSSNELAALVIACSVSIAVIAAVYITMRG